MGSGSDHSISRDENEMDHQSQIVMVQWCSSRRDREVEDFQISNCEVTISMRCRRDIDTSCELVSHDATSQRATTDHMTATQRFFCSCRFSRGDKKTREQREEDHDAARYEYGGPSGMSSGCSSQSFDGGCSQRTKVAHGQEALARVQEQASGRS